jgi:Tfp pilus assembly protein PilO
MLDRLKEFWRSQPFVTVCVVICVTSLIGVWWVRRQTAAYDSELMRVTNQGTETMGLVAMRNMLQSELKLVQNTIQRTEDNLVAEENLADNLWYFYSIEGRTETRLTELRQLDPPTPGADDSFMRIPYELSATGDFGGISEFLRQLEIGPRLIHIEEFSLRREAQADELISLDLSIEMLGSL